MLPMESRSFPPREIMASYVLGQVADSFGVASLNPFKAERIKQEGWSRITLPDLRTRARRHLWF